jgi:tetratricopeptide (TPR) repeat protein
MLLGCLLTGAALTAAVLGGSELLPRLRQQLHAQLARAEHGRPNPEFWNDLRKATLAFPADPYFPLLGSSAALSAGSNPLPWISRALERAPHQAEPHLQLARILRARGATDQALGALRHAVELDVGQSKPALNLGLAWGLTPAALRAAVPEGPGGARLLRLLATRTSEPAARLEWLTEAVERAPEEADSQYWLAAVLLEDLKRKQGAILCQDRAACARSIREHAALGDRAGDPRLAVLEAELEAEEGNAKAGEAGLLRACERYSGNAGCDTALIELAMQNQSEELPRAVKRYLASSCATEERCGQAELRLGHLFSRAGRWNVALTHYERAARQAPAKATWQALADISRRLGNQALEAEALRHVHLLDSENHFGDADDASAETKPTGLGPPAP